MKEKEKEMDGTYIWTETQEEWFAVLNIAKERKLVWRNNKPVNLTNDNWFWDVYEHNTFLHLTKSKIYMGSIEKISEDVANRILTFKQFKETL